MFGLTGTDVSKKPIIFRVEDKDNVYLSNAGIQLPNYTDRITQACSTDTDLPNNVQKGSITVEVGEI